MHMFTFWESICKEDEMSGEWTERKEDKEADPCINPARIHHENFPALLSEMNVSMISVSHSQQCRAL